MVAPPPTPLLEARDLRVAYGPSEVLHAVSLTLRAGEVTAIIGPNGSGKSTLLRALARLVRPAAGSIRLRGRELRSIAPRDFAREVAYLPQAPEAPGELTVEELAWRGRYPHRGLLRAASAEDHRAVEAALVRAGVAELRRRPLATLSGGERQRAWLALTLAQQAELLLLDEPTTFLDIGHQLELLTLLRELAERPEAGAPRTVLMVMHDIGLAAHFARRVVALRAGRVLFDGPPAEVVTAERVSALFGARVTILRDPASGTPVVVPVAPAERS